VLLRIKTFFQNEVFLRWARVVAFIVTALAGAFLTIYFLGGMLVNVQGLTVRISARPALHGTTVLDLSPLGQVLAETHRAPVQLRVRLEEISMDTVKSDWLNKATQGKTIGIVRERGPAIIINFALRELALAFAGSMLLVLLLWRPPLRLAFLGGAASAILVAAMLSAVGLSYNLEAFREPHFEGPISMATSTLKMVDDSLNHLEQVKDQTGQVVSNIKALFTNINSLAVLGDPAKEKGTKAVLLVSDLHSNPIGLEFMRTLSQQFQIDFIVDAGDITDLGSPLEAGMIEGLTHLNVPHLSAAGNHDTPEITRFLAGIKDTYVLNGKTLELDGLRILGVPDPLSSTTEVEIKDGNKKEQVYDAYMRSIRLALKKEGRPDILVVHNVFLARDLIREAPLVVAGHDHSLSLEGDEGGFLIDPGTTGAAGLRGFYSEMGTPYTAVIVYVQPNRGPLAADIIRYDPMSAQFSLDRQLIPRM